MPSMDDGIDFESRDAFARAASIANAHERGPRAREFQVCFENALKSCVETPTAQEFIRAFPGLNPSHHEPLFACYADVLALVYENAKAEFATICVEECIDARLNAIDDVCARRGVSELDVCANAMRVVNAGRVPDDVARATRAAAKRNELEALRVEAASAERAAQETIEALEGKRDAVRQASNSLKLTMSGDDAVREASLQWASRASQRA